MLSESGNPKTLLRAAGKSEHHLTIFKLPQRNFFHRGLADHSPVSFEWDKSLPDSGFARSGNSNFICYFLDPIPAFVLPPVADWKAKTMNNHGQPNSIPSSTRPEAQSILSGQLD